ncbi:enoyl-CoA hydratase/isomerase family protein [Arthrobacter polaris]|uniref:enoyl-CoA hydratase/isomerase family protein n=1 Tax=Arthrobacter polaris TaxID=2813727 RepID=UPI001F335927|nr:enoyl-CoA hydratase-related protein [Arthrobacter polaris]UIK87895.1 enoyl-CoA hydratase/isomerase family protein [Arthrobacter polaris]
MSELVTREQRGAVALLTLNRPEALNALGADLVARLTDRLADAGADPAVRAVVITGSDKAFCAGADITEVPEMIGAMPTAVLPFDRLFAILSSLPKPTIAAVRGLALGGGCELVLACDIAVAGRSARFGVPEVKLGVIPGAGGTQRLVHAVGKAKAMRMLLTGSPVDAAWANAAGLVADVVDDSEVLNLALDIAAQIALNAPLAVALAADSARTAHEAPLHQSLNHERRNFLLALGTTDAQEGIAAFTERRTPHFIGK